MDAATTSLVGQTIAERYTIVSELGSGGFGAVYMGRHIELKSPVALKILHPHLAKDETLVERFRREATATSRLRHPAIAAVHDIGVLPDQRPYMVMEYLHGRSLADVMAEEGGPLLYQRVVPLFVECCDGLRYAHRLGLLHRDIKPDNIYVCPDMDGVEHVKLLDFGLAKVFTDENGQSLITLTETGTCLGTPWYMSPEQCQALPLDARSDIYSLAYTLYEALAGRRPFNAHTPYQVMHAHVHDPVPPINKPGQEPLVPEQLERAVIRALSKSVHDRYSTTEEFKQALLAAVPDLVVSPLVSAAPVEAAVPVVAKSKTPSGGAAPARKISSAKKAVKNTQQIAVLSSVLVVLGVVAAGGFWWHERSLESNKQQTSAAAQHPLPETAKQASSPRSTESSEVTNEGSPPPLVQYQPPPRAVRSTATKERVPQQIQAEQSAPSDPKVEEEAKRMKDLEERNKALQAQVQQQALQQPLFPQSTWSESKSSPLFSSPTETKSSIPTVTTPTAPPNFGDGSNLPPAPDGRPPLGNGLPPGFHNLNELPPGWRPGDPLPPGALPPRR